MEIFHKVGKYSILFYSPYSKFQIYIQLFKSKRFESNYYGIYFKLYCVHGISPCVTCNPHRNFCQILKIFQYCSIDYIRKFEIPLPLFKFERIQSHYYGIYLKNILCVWYPLRYCTKSTWKYLTKFKKIQYYPKKSHILRKMKIDIFDKVPKIPIFF